MSAGHGVSSSRWTGLLSLFVFLFPLGAQLGNWKAVVDDPSNGLGNINAIRGVPLWDAQVYDCGADDFSRGYGIPEGCRRFFYPAVLATLYTWTGPHFSVAILLNVLMSATATWLLAEATRRIAGWPAALGVAAWLALEPVNLTQSTAVMSETMGFFLLAWHIERMIAGMPAGNRPLVWSGALLSLSNLARSLTLLAAPVELVLLFLLRWRCTRSFRSGLMAAFAFGIGIVLVVVPATLINYRRTGVMSLSDNVAMHLYAATSREYTEFNMAIENIPVQQGISDAKGKYDFFMKQVRENLANDPGAFYDNILRNVQRPLVDLDRRDSRLYLELVSLLIAVQIAAAALAQPRWSTLAIAIPSLLWPLGLSWLLWRMGIDPSWSYILYATSAIAIVVSLFRPRDGSILLAAVAGMTILTCGIFVHFEERLSIYITAPLFMLAAVGTSHLAAAPWRLFGRAATWATPSEEDSRSTVGKWLIIVIGTVIVVGGLKIAYHRWIDRNPQQKIEITDVPFEQIVRAVQFVAEQRPELFTDAERARIAAQAARPDERVQEFFQFLFDWHGRGALQALVGKVGRYRYQFPKGDGHWTEPSFARRGYDRDVAALELWGGGPAPYFARVVFPGDALQVNQGRVGLVLGRINDGGPENPNHRFFEAIAWIPFDRATKRLLSDQAVVVDEPEHLKILAELKPTHSPLPAR